MHVVCSLFDASSCLASSLGRELPRQTACVIKTNKQTTKERNKLMAEVAVGFLVQKLCDLLVQEAINLYGVRGEVEWLERELGRMQCFLKDADAKKNKGDDERVKNWVTKMRDLAYEAEDIIDNFMDLNLRRSLVYEAEEVIDTVMDSNPRGFLDTILDFNLRCFLDTVRRIHGNIRNTFESNVSKRRKIGMDIDGIKDKLKKLSESRKLYGIANIGETTGTTSQSRSQNVIPILPQLSDDIDMVGFIDEKEKIVRELVNINNTDRSVISIVGMGGLGKTTLAKFVYNDHKVKRSFDIFAWVIISQEYTIHEVLKIISSEVSATPLADTIIDLSVAISKQLMKGKYLIVLDDVWEENVCLELSKVFPNVKNGSRVVITTRIKNVAVFAYPPSQRHDLRLLNEKESKELFLRKAFPRQDIKTCCPTYLVEYAHQLVERCGGLPLALVVLGGLVSTKAQTQGAWRKVVESMKGQFVEGGDRCLEILALSYNDLPYYLKTCFLYFGCFKEDEQIFTETLIRLWSAEGFLPTKNGKAIDEFGSDCLEELAQRCLIQVIEMKYHGGKYCRIHDLLRDMCISEAQENKFLEIYQNDTANCATMANAARRLIIFNKMETLNYSNSYLRGLLFYEYIDYDTPKGWLGKFKLLRVLHLKNEYMPEIPREIKSLIHLRYLQLDFLVLKEVPSWIGHLHNLQTFIVSSDKLEKISDSLWTIGNLRHVNLSMSGRADPPNMGNNVPKNLQTLKMVHAGSWIGNTLPKLTNLCELGIVGVSNDHADALSSSLQKLGRLASLSIKGYHEIPSDIITAFSNQHCLENLSLNGSLNRKRLPYNDEFPQQLVKLTLGFSNLEQDPMVTLEKLPCLKYLTLFHAYIGKQMICSATGFPQLLALSIFYLDELEEWKIEEKAMSFLKYLSIGKCDRLKMIPEGLKNVPLNRLDLFVMSKEFKTRVKKNTGEDWYKIQHVPNMSIIPKDEEIVEEIAEEINNI